MKIKCLVLDHDDTVVESTPFIHYPSFVEALKVLRPERELSLESFVSYCFNPGFSELCKDIMGFDAQEQSIQYEIWKRYTRSIIPEFYPGFTDLISQYKAAGGIICVVSHSEKHQIIRDYHQNCGIEPDLVFGWELEAAYRKPNPYPLLEIQKAFNVDKKEMLMVDDLKPGLDMAKQCGVPFAAAGWSHRIPEIKTFMQTHADIYFSTVEALRNYLFD